MFQTRTILGIEVDCSPLPEYPRGGMLLAELAYIAAPALGALGAAIAGKIDLSLPPAEIAKAALTSLGPDGAGKLIGALEGSMQRLLREDPKTAQRVTDELLCGCVATVPKDGGGLERVELNTPGKIQLAIKASGKGYAFLAKLWAFAFEVNFGGPFVGAFAGISRPPVALDGSPTPTP